jgi:outer membrane biosynthesis protein TonB
MKNNDFNLTAVAEPRTVASEDNSWGEEAEKTGARKWLMPTLVMVTSVIAAYSVGKKLTADKQSAKNDAQSVPYREVIPEPPPLVATPPPPTPEEQVREDKEVEEKQEEATPPDQPNLPKTDLKGPRDGVIPIGQGKSPLIPKRAGSGISQAQKDFGLHVANTIEEALRRHPIAKTAAGVAPKVRASVSADGRITGLVLESSTGNPTLDRIISEELTNLRTPSIAPEGTKFITVRISLRRPN